VAKLYVYRSRVTPNNPVQLGFEKLDERFAEATAVELVGTIDVDPIPDPAPDGNTT